MNSNRRILFLVDHKHRDLPSLSLIGYLLQKKGYDVKYNAIWLENEIINEFNPGYIVLPKPVYAIDRLIKFKIDGRKTIVINTEGNPQDIKLAMKIPMPPDLFFFWNQTQLELDKKILNESRIELAGCPRMDFLMGELYESIFPSKHELLEKYNLSDKNKTITIATSCQDAHFDEKLIQQKEKIRKKKFREAADYRDIVNNMRNLRDNTGEIIKGIVENFPNMNIILKPHPNENIVYWKELVSSLNTKNIFVSLGEPIYHLLKISDLHISYNVCTTTYEAMITGVPTVELHTKNSESLYSTDHLYLADFIIESFDNLIAKVEEVLVNNTFIRDQIKKDQLNKYTEKYLYKVDGNRCSEYASKIDSFISHSTLIKDEINFIKEAQLLLKYSYLIGRKPISVIKQRLIQFINGKDKIIKENNIDSSLDHLGRYDNRIKLGDEEFWFKKFKNLNIA
jgi:surface carbohydrate biosynthesis protein